MSWVDWLIVAVIVLSALAAAAQGFLFEVISLGGLVVGYMAAAWEYQRVAAWFAPYVKSQFAANAAGFLAILFAVMVLAGLVARLARWKIKDSGLRWFDRLLGGVFGLARGVLLVMIMLVAAAAWAPDSGWLSRSQLAPYLLVMGRAAVWVAPSEVRLQFQQGLKHLRDLRAGEKKN